jgi:acetylornithine/LysW-gamma-L-lysine aminotransferase
VAIYYRAYGAGCLLDESVKNCWVLPLDENRMTIKAIEDRHSAGTYPKRDLVLVRGEGAKVFDESGRAYIDCVAGPGVAGVGHSNPRVVEAIARQAGRLINCYESFYNDARAAFYESLAKIVPSSLDRFFLCNSGAEAVEGALKFARLAGGKHGVIAMQRGFHGKTLGALSVTGSTKYREGFEPLLEGVRHVPFNDVAALERAFVESSVPVGAVIIELIQGEGGIWPAQPEFVQAARSLCDQHAALLIVDEIQTGMGRTGRFFVSEHYGVTPDIMTIAKAIAGGVPMGVIALGGRVADIPKLSHTSTFGGNPLACAAGEAVIEFMLEERLPEQAAAKGDYLISRLRKIESHRVRDIRGLGLMIGIELKERAQKYVTAVMQEGVLALLAGPTVIRLMPPLVISYQEIDQVVGALEKVLRDE